MNERQRRIQEMTKKKEEKIKINNYNIIKIKKLWE